MLFHVSLARWCFFPLEHCSWRFTR